MTDPRVRGASPARVEGSLRRLLTEADGDFVPPLSARTSTVQTDLGAARPAAGVEPYLTSLMDQELLVAEQGGDVLGFASYRPHHTIDVAGHPPIGPVCYLTTIIVSRGARGSGLGRALYGGLIAAADRIAEPLATRTWSGNDAHIALLTDLGLAEAIRLPGHRGPGLDTVYYVRAPKGVR